MNKDKIGVLAEFIRNNLTLSIYALVVTCILGFYAYSTNVGYKWFAPYESGFVPGGPQMTHK